MCRLGATRSWEENEPGQLTQTDQKNIPYRLMSHSAYKLGGKLVPGCCSDPGWVSVSGWWAVASCIIWFVYSNSFIAIIIIIITIFSPFFYPIKLSLSQLVDLTFFFSWFSPPSHCGGESDWAAAWCLSACWINSQQSSNQPPIFTKSAGVSVF